MRGGGQCPEIVPGRDAGASARLARPMRKGEPPKNLVDETDRGSLVAGLVDLEHSDECAVIDGGEQIETPFRARDPLEELHVQLPAMSGLGLLPT